jgi:hypothetical protein
MNMKPVRFINEPVEARFDPPPLLEKMPGCPNSFLWRGSVFQVVELVSEWHDYHRRGRSSRNMKPEHAAVAEHRGSWGVGLDYYRVRTDSGRFFDLCFDRAPKGSDHRKGSWFLEKEVE